VKNKYLKFSLEKLLDDQEFVSWALHATHNNEWNIFFCEHPDFSVKVQKAKEIILLLKDRYDEPDRGDVLNMWQNIESYYNVQQEKGKTLSLKRTLLLKKVFRYAAILFLVFTIGTTTYLYFAGSNQKYEFALGDSVPKNGEAKLVLPNGEEVQLKKENSSIVIKGKEEILVNNEKLIDLRNRQQIIKEEVKMNEVIIPYGKKSNLVLDDGTKVWLCAGSRLAFPTVFNGKKREVYLDGEAYFEVTHMPDRPFVVNSREVSIKVLGTRFFLSACSSDEKIVTVLMEGSVALNENTSLGFARKDVILEPGQKASFDKSNKKISVEPVDDVKFYIAWTKGWFFFSKENLFTIFNKLERYYNIKFVYDKSFLSDDLISGKLDLKDSISDVLETLSELARISYKIENGNIYIERKLK
jgi:transmembrane sensor